MLYEIRNSDSGETVGETESREEAIEFAIARRDSLIDDGFDKRDAVHTIWIDDHFVAKVEWGTSLASLRRKS
jgi:hypothetical protein